MHSESTAGQSPSQLARLLAIGRKRGDAARDRNAQETLQDMLARELSLDVREPDSLPAVLSRPRDELRAHVGRALGELLLEPDAGLNLLEALKNYGKALVQRNANQAERAAATAVYYAAIARALLLHGRKITQHSFEKLEDAFAKLEPKPWIPPRLKDLFAKVRKQCQTLNAETGPL